MNRAARVAAPDRIMFGDLRLERVDPRSGESDRYETPFPGPGPIGVWLARGSEHHQWCAGFIGGVVAYSYDALDALEEARDLAVSSLYYQAARLSNLELE